MGEQVKPESVLSEDEVTTIMDSAVDLYHWEAFESQVGDIAEAVQDVVRAAVRDAEAKLLAKLNPNAVWSEGVNFGWDLAVSDEPVFSLDANPYPLKEETKDV